LGNLDGALQSLSKGLELDPTNVTAAADRDLLIAAKQRIEGCKSSLASRSFSQALSQCESIVRDLGSGIRDVNIIRVECLLELKRPQDAFNLSNAMVRAMNLSHMTHHQVVQLRVCIELIFSPI
jgi:hypothetical protein